MNARVASVMALTLVGLLTAAVAAPQQPPAKKAGDPQSTFEPRSGPGEGQKYLARMVGEWDVAKVFYPRTGDPARSKGTCRQTMIQGGRFLQSDFLFGEGDRQSTGTGIIGFEPETSVFTSVWFDSRQTRMSMRHSKVVFDGKEILLEAATLGEVPKGKEIRRTRTHSRVSDDGNTITHRQFLVTPDGQEDRLQMELVMTRKTGAAAAKPATP